MYLAINFAKKNINQRIFGLQPLFALILTVSSESEKPKTKTVKDQKPENSAFLQKFLPKPLQYNINQRYGGLSGQEYFNEAVLKLKNEGLLKNDYNGYYDYNDGNEEYYLKNDGGSINPGLPYNVPNIWGYSRNGGLGKLISHSYNGDSNVWGYLRNNNGRLRNEEGKVRSVNREYPRTQGRQRGLDYGVLNNLNAYLEPENIGYVGLVGQGKGIKDRYYFRLIGRKGLGFDKRTAAAYGLYAPITPKLLEVEGGGYLRKFNYHDMAGNGYKL